MTVDFGLAVPPALCGFSDHEGGTVLTSEEWVAHLEVPGVHSLWALDQTLGRSATAEPLSVLSYLAALTEDVRLGVAVLVGASRGPVATAKGFATLDWLSGGRLDLGLGLGGAAHYPAYGIDPRAAGGPGAVLDEFIEVLRRLWTEESVDFEGRLWKLHEATMAPKPLQQPHPPLWIGGGSDRALQRAIDLRAGWVGAGRHSTDEFVTLARRLAGMLEEQGVARDALRIAKRVYVLVASDRASADRMVKDWFARFYRRPELGAKVTIAGTVDECAEQLVPLAEAGIDEIVLHPLIDHVEQYDAITQDLIETFRSSS